MLIRILKGLHTCFCFVIFSTICIRQVIAQQPAAPLAQQPAAPPHALQINDEAAKVFQSAQEQIKKLPLDQRANVIANVGKEFSATQQSTATLGVTATDPSLVLEVKPEQLTLNQRMILTKAMIDGMAQNTQQVVNPGIIPTVPTTEGLRNAVTTLNQMSLGDPLLSPDQLKPLLQQYQSIGRLLWTRQDLLSAGTPMWQLAGTVFVTSPGVVTTACHTLMGTGDQPLIDLAGNPITIHSGLVLEVEFSNTSQYQTMYRVSSIAAISNHAGCDVAQLVIHGATGIPPLKIAAKNTKATRILVVGYPQLATYSSTYCSLGLGGVTDAQFCKFHAANPTIAKIGSPGHVLSWDTHDGVSVFTYDAPTDGGQSGSPVFDADTLEVIGIHYCCSGAAQNTSALSCATWHPQNVSWNEAIASETIVTDNMLKPNFSDVDQASVAAAFSHIEALSASATDVSTRVPILNSGQRIVSSQASVQHVY